jgi:hypothetical protein
LGRRARVDPQRDKLTSQLSELEATERVLARYSKGTRARKTASGKTETTATQAAAPAGQRGRRRTTTAKPAGDRRSSPSLNDQVLALATGKTQREITAACYSKGTRARKTASHSSENTSTGRLGVGVGTRGNRQMAMLLGTGETGDRRAPLAQLVVKKGCEYDFEPARAGVGVSSS